MTADPDKHLEPLPDGKFRFECRPDVPCFTECCAKLNLALTPYDVLRLARGLEITTTEFLEKHVVGEDVPGKLPVARLAMDLENEGRCPFVTEKGCSVYGFRPSACRTYPLARASSPGKGGGPNRIAHFVLKEPHCRGFEEQREWTVEEWNSDQEIQTYNELNDLWMEVVTRQAEVLDSPGADQKIGMFNLASYDLDEFRRFVFEGGLLKRLDLSPLVVKKLEENDLQLLRFAMAWLKLALFGEASPGLSRP